MDNLDLELVEPIRTSNGRYENPFSTFAGLPGSNKGWRFFKESMYARCCGPPNPTPEEYNRNLPIKVPDQAKLNNPPPDKLQYMWIGHASVLYQTQGWNILSDPIWSERCSPFSFMGPKRYRPPPLTIAELPRIDAVLISHNHYDHLDYQSVLDLNARFGKRLHWFVPEGLKSWFTARHCETVTELSWWRSATLSGDESSYGEAVKPDLEITCTPAQHWSLRTGCDRNQSLWSSWVLKTPKHSIWFSGDTAYCDAFEAIGRKFGPFDLSAIAIGAYCPRYFMSNQHVDPEQAYQIHLDINSKLSIGIHWGTFPMGSTEPYMEPRELIYEIQKDKPEPASFVCVNHGEVLSIA